jgi:hypothetical protein
VRRHAVVGVAGRRPVPAAQRAAALLGQWFGP